MEKVQSNSSVMLVCVLWLDFGVVMDCTGLWFGTCYVDTHVDTACSTTAEGPFAGYSVCTPATSTWTLLKEHMRRLRSPLRPRGPQFMCEVVVPLARPQADPFPPSIPPPFFLNCCFYASSSCSCSGSHWWIPVGGRRGWRSPCRGEFHFRSFQFVHIF